MTIGSHTWDHRAVSDLSGRDWKIQLEQSRTTLERASGQPVEHFAYPYATVNTKLSRACDTPATRLHSSWRPRNSITKSRWQQRGAAPTVITQQHLI